MLRIIFYLAVAMIDQVTSGAGEVSGYEQAHYAAGEVIAEQTADRIGCCFEGAIAGDAAQLYTLKH